MNRESVSIRSFSSNTPLHQLKADLFKSLGHPVRIRVLEILLTGPHTVSALLQEIEIEASHLSGQLAVLRNNGMVHATRTGNSVSYELANRHVADVLAGAKKFLSASFAETQQSINQLQEP